MMFLGNLLISFFFKEPIPALVLNQAWLGQVGYTLSMLGAMYAVVIGFRYLEPSIGTLLGLLEIIFATLFGVIFFGESLSPIIIAGGILILLAGTLPKIFTKNET